MAEPAYTVEVHRDAETVAATPPAHPGSHYSLAGASRSPRPIDNDCRTGILAKAEIRTKRFIDHRRVEEERYNAEVMAPDSSLHSVMQALTQAFAGHGRVHRAAAGRRADRHGNPAAGLTRVEDQSEPRSRFRERGFLYA